MPASVRRDAIARYAMVGLLGLLVLAFSLRFPGIFFTWGNLRAILAIQAVLTVLAVGMLLPLVAGHFAVSAAASAGLASVVVVSLILRYETPVPVAIAATLALTTLVGTINAFLVVRLEINSLIATLGMSTLLFGVAVAYTGSGAVTGDFPDSLVALGRTTIMGLPLPVYYAAAIVLIVWYMLQHTPLGRFMYAVGGSPEASRLAGINNKRVATIAFLICEFIAGVAGIMSMLFLGMGDASYAPTLLFPALTAVFLGAAAIKIASFNVLGTVIAGFTIAVAVSGLSLMGVSTWVNLVLNGAGLIGALTIVRYLHRQAV